MLGVCPEPERHGELLSMADVSKIVAALQQSMEGVSKAQNTTQLAGSRAQDLQNRAARTGFRKIAEGMGQVIQRLKRIYQMEAAMLTTLKAAGASVQGVESDTNPKEVVGTLGPVVKQIDGATTDTGAVIAEVDAAKVEVTEALEGGNPAPMLATLDQVKQALTQIANQFGDAKQRTEETMAEARRTGNF
jgi:transcription antitermination factor NusG